MEDIILYFALKYEGDFQKIFYAIMIKEEVNYNELKKMKEELNCNYVTVISKNYPSKLKHLNRPPFVIFYIGDLSLIDNKSISIIGSRNCSEYGMNMCNKIVRDLVKENYTIISGLALGIDSISHVECLNNFGKTIAVLGNGVNEYYPYKNNKIQREIEKKGLLISEYPPNVKPNRMNFPKRNRIISALGDGLVVIEASKRSGTMITVNEALNLGKDVMCLPFRADEESGCNDLIKNGAYLIEGANDVIEILNMSKIM
jgi:DNA processing protein